MIESFQIEENKIFTSIKFNGDIGVTPLVNNKTKVVNKLCFSNLDKIYEIGTSFPEYIGRPFNIEDKDVILSFNSYKSVDIVINALNEIKQSLMNEEMENNKPIIFKHNLYKSITYKEKTIIPILELAKLSFPDEIWEVNIVPACVSSNASGFSFDKDGLFFRYESNDYWQDVIEYVENQEELVELIKEYYNE